MRYVYVSAVFPLSFNYFGLFLRMPALECPIFSVDFLSKAL